jgi:hypothetical protein
MDVGPERAQGVVPVPAAEGPELAKGKTPGHPCPVPAGTGLSYSDSQDWGSSQRWTISWDWSGGLPCIPGLLQGPTALQTHLHCSSGLHSWGQRQKLQQESPLVPPRQCLEVSSGDLLALPRNLGRSWARGPL